MKVWSAIFILNRDWKNNKLINYFDFKKEEDEDYEKTEYGYFRHEGWICDRLEDNVDVINSYNLAKVQKYFDRELDEKEVAQLKEQMKNECIQVLEKKKQNMIKNLNEQIEYLKNIQK